MRDCMRPAMRRSSQEVMPAKVAIKTSTMTATSSSQTAMATVIIQGSSEKLAMRVSNRFFIGSCSVILFRVQD